MNMLSVDNVSSSLKRSLNDRAYQLRLFQKDSPAYCHCLCAAGGLWFNFALTAIRTFLKSWQYVTLTGCPPSPPLANICGFPLYKCTHMIKMSRRFTTTGRFLEFARMHFICIHVYPTCLLHLSHKCILVLYLSFILEGLFLRRSWASPSRNYFSFAL